MTETRVILTPKVLQFKLDRLSKEYPRPDDYDTRVTHVYYRFRDLYMSLDDFSDRILRPAASMGYRVVLHREGEDES